MREREIDGFLLRSDATKRYGRSKSSFIRDVDDAFSKSDSEFLGHIRVYLKDGTVVEGIDATKEKVSSLQKMQPWVYISTELLETRYWEANAAPDRKEKGSRSRGYTDCSTR